MYRLMLKMVNQKCKQIYSSASVFFLSICIIFLPIFFFFELFRKGDLWPPRVFMQLMPKQLVGNIGGEYLKDSKTVVFHPSTCESLENLTKVMSSGFVSLFFNLFRQYFAIVCSCYRLAVFISLNRMQDVK